MPSPAAPTPWPAGTECADCGGTGTADWLMFGLDRCEWCEGTGKVSDRRSPYDPTPGPLMLCDACTDAEAQAQAAAQVEGR